MSPASPERLRLPASIRRVRTLVFLAALASFVLSGCPDRNETTEKIGGAPGRMMQKAKEAAERAGDKAVERFEQLGDE
ncbi:hypothetical protein [Vulgatibacter incomptus]|uniref:Uncharacterized protein n=1 Tax=Vulgatibacter incomptus TaxID=1391653 RepID=A0A0K1PI93_9BACT|nr:hypothetical protein [Vulgatibacter incomptus]AKU93240.1 hypothetical protein AKJ08_3627 [Vulgatibacter incomptus]